MKGRYLDLHENLSTHACLYYAYDVQLVSNAVFDSWKKEFFAFQKAYGDRLPPVGDYWDCGLTSIRRARYLLYAVCGIDKNERSTNPVFDKPPPRWRRRIKAKYQL
jgi:hypothetical protein